MKYDVLIYKYKVDIRQKCMPSTGHNSIAIGDNVM